MKALYPNTLSNQVIQAPKASASAFATVNYGYRKLFAALAKAAERRMSVFNTQELLYSMGI
jgi:hypothetical protein